MAEDIPTKHERTFIMIKPDGVQRGLIADIIKRFEQRGYKLVAMKFMKVITLDTCISLGVKVGRDCLL